MEERLPRPRVVINVLELKTLVKPYMVYGKSEPLFYFDMKALYDWSVYGATRKLVMLVAFVVLISSMVTVTHSQSGIQVQVNDVSKRVDKLEELPNQVTKLTEQIAELRRESEEHDNKNFVIYSGLLIALGGLVIERLMSAWGGKIRDRTERAP